MSVREGRSQIRGAEQGRSRLQSSVPRASVAALLPSQMQ